MPCRPQMWDPGRFSWPSRLRVWSPLRASPRPGLSASTLVRSWVTWKHSSLTNTDLGLLRGVWLLRNEEKQLYWYHETSTRNLIRVRCVIFSVWIKYFSVRLELTKDDHSSAGYHSPWSAGIETWPSSKCFLIGFHCGRPSPQAVWWGSTACSALQSRGHSCVFTVELRGKQEEPLSSADLFFSSHPRCSKQGSCVIKRRAKPYVKPHIAWKEIKEPGTWCALFSWNQDKF